MFDPMKATGLDTLKATRSLEAAGFNPAQAEALVNVLGGPVAGSVATKGDMRELRLELKAEIKDLRVELKEEIAECRSELKAEIGQLRDETKAEMVDLRAQFASLSREVADVRVEVRGDIRSLGARMYRLLLVQATVIVGLIVGLQQLL